MAEANVIKTPRVIFDEVTPPPGPFADWVARREVRDRLVLAETIPISRVRHVLEHGYAPDLTDVEIDEIGKDPFLVAAAMAASRPGRRYGGSVGAEADTRELQGAGCLQ